MNFFFPILFNVTCHPRLTFLRYDLFHSSKTFRYFWHRFPTLFRVHTCVQGKVVVDFVNFHFYAFLWILINCKCLHAYIRNHGFLNFDIIPQIKLSPRSQIQYMGNKNCSFFRVVFHSSRVLFKFHYAKLQRAFSGINILTTLKEIQILY